LRYPETQQESGCIIEALVGGVTTRADLVAEVVANTPASYGNLVFNKIDSAELIEGTLDQWKCKLRYAQFRDRQPLAPGETYFQFGSAQRTIRRTISRSSRVFDDASGTEQTYFDNQIIGFNEQTLRAEGVDDTEYINSFSWRVAVPFSTATESYRRSLGALRGSVNNAPFFGYPAGEVQFKDITGNTQGAEVYVWRLDFLQGVNPGNVTVGGILCSNVTFWEIFDIDDQQWYLDESKWLWYPRVRRVKVHKIKRDADWTLLSTLLGV